MNIFHYLLFICLYLISKTESCTKVTFVNVLIQITIKDSDGDFKEGYTASITGCIVPEIIAEQLGNLIVRRIECYNQSVPTLHEGAVSNLPELYSLIISYSKIKKIKSKPFSNLPSLISLTLSYNEIESIDDNAFANLDSLIRLNLIGNKIAFLSPGIFSKMPVLKDINMGGNQLEVFEAEWFSENSPLQEINLQNNFIRSIHRNTFNPFKELYRLDLTSNRIQHIHKDAFVNLKSLDSLFLSDNRIRKLESDIFEGLQSIAALWLNGNNLTYMPEKVLQDLKSPNLFQITIHTNPWQCTCYNKITKWASEHKPTVFINTATACHNDNIPVCIFPSENVDLCLESRDEDLNKIFYEIYTGNDCN